MNNIYQQQLKLTKMIHILKCERQFMMGCVESEHNFEHHW